MVLKACFCDGEVDQMKQEPQSPLVDLSPDREVAQGRVAEVHATHLLVVSFHEGWSRDLHTSFV